ncbi:SRPBCC family protein [Chitinophaga flava]|uniref:MxaD family protein n=1 Tax=Chitinophaga flava TaxID=2259036 RepID=A0A365Y874_9BACT|nr:SRPBCC family protein [Chitinophaga flava]RBL94095.1 MxaD family protein [Chitinophaga flava]
MTGFTSIAFAQSNSKVAQIKIEATVNASAESTFIYIVPVSLPHIFKRYKKFPAIVKTDEPEKWTKPGLSRTISFEDGSTAKESLLTVTPYSSFSYKVENFTSQLRFLAKRVDGDWKFTDIGNGQTKIEWTYKVVPRNFIARGVIKAFLIKDIRHMLENALIILKDDLDSKKNCL